MIRILLWVIVAYIIYQFVFKFLIPLITVSRQMKRQIRDFQQQSGFGQENYRPYNQQHRASEEKKKDDKVGEYIDFEEIKEK